MKTAPRYPRFAAAPLEHAPADSPAGFIHGPRRSGKTALAQMAGKRLGYDYFSFDDTVLAGAAESDPIGFVHDLPERAVLDEVQRIPAVFPAIKAAVDRRRAPGRFLLTGSADALFVPSFAEALVGRMEILRLHPLAQCELIGKPSRFLEAYIVMERCGRELAGVEVKASATVVTADFRGLRKLQAIARDRFVAGVVLYDGEVSAGFGNRFFAVPIRALWEMT